MKLLIALAWCAAISFVGAQQGRLSEREREDFLKRVREIRDAADSRIEARFRIAITSYRNAMASDDAAVALYLNCVEKLDFTDKNRRPGDFVEWRRKNDARLKSPAFRRALRHQLRWLVLSLQATSDTADRTRLASDARQILDSMVSDASSLKGHHEILSQPVTGSVFARAYEIGNVNVKDWVFTPSEIGQIYEQIIMPPYRTSRRADSLRSAWIKRIQQELHLLEEWSPEVNDGRSRIAMASELVSPEVRKFRTEELPRRQWQMEVDLFKNGDPAGAAARMLSHLDQYATHAALRDWVIELEQLLMAAVSSPADPTFSSEHNPLVPSPRSGEEQPVSAEEDVVVPNDEDLMPIE